MPDFNKLRRLYDFIMHEVPPDKLNLNFLWDPASRCGCAVGWAQRAPAFAGQIGRSIIGWPEAASGFFGTSEVETVYLFGGLRLYEAKQHKLAWHDRMQQFFMTYHEPLGGPAELALFKPEDEAFRILRQAQHATAAPPVREPELVD